ncbi:hypothetical protein CfE428DRAFT_1518 [Chthoniobacter flavus Ellin428]|uniref:Uncharacterized protein n=1 Tax=Chthoniobacter flavus Ellin428 TaxID=497964 RepID=B4CY77_9BACT|nr:hypothetical protein CfE428DRAFT_1518 [Chthoniobacter flavus Ellin428]
MNISTHSQPATDRFRGEKRVVRRAKNALCGASVVVVTDINLEFAN